MDAEKLLEIVRYFTGKRGETSPEALLYHDLSISGDDAVEFLDKVHTTFGTSFEGFEFEVYFPYEGELDAIFSHWGRWLGLWRSRYKPLTIGHLLSVIEAGHWFEPDSAPRPGRVEG